MTMIGSDYKNCPQNAGSRALLIEKQFLLSNFACSLGDVVHGLRPTERIGGFQLFGNTLGFGKFGDQGVIQFGRLAVNFDKMFVQFAGRQQGDVGPFAMRFEKGEVLPTEATDFLLFWKCQIRVENTVLFNKGDPALLSVFHVCFPLLYVYDLFAMQSLPLFVRIFFVPYQWQNKKKSEHLSYGKDVRIFWFWSE